MARTCLPCRRTHGLRVDKFSGAYPTQCEPLCARVRWADGALRKRVGLRRRVPWRGDTRTRTPFSLSWPLQRIGRLGW